MRVGVARDLLEHLAEAQQVQRERLLLRGVDRDRCAERRRVDAGLAQDAADARVGVLQVGRGVALEAEHRVPAEHVVGGARLAEVGVLDRADADLARHRGARVVGQVGVLLRHQPRGARDRFVEQVGEFHDPPGAGSERLAVLAHHGAEGVVLETRRLVAEAGAPAHREDLLHVQRLARVDEVEDAVRAQFAAAVAQRGEVGGGVEETATRLLHDHRLRVALLVGELVEEHHLRALVLDRETLLLQGGDGPGQRVIVGALGADVGARQRDAETVVDRLAVADRDLDELVPQRQAARVARLQLHDVFARAVGEAGLVVEARLRLAVEALEVGQRGLGRGLRLAVLEVRDQHAELGAPVADVVLADHAVTEVGQQPCQRVADDGRAQVPDVHLLGQVGRRVVDDHRLRRVGLRDAQARVVEDPAQLRAKPGRREVDVDEAGTGDLKLLDRVAEVERGDGRLGQRARVGAQLLGRAHRAVGLVVAELRLGGLGHQRRCVGGRAGGGHRPLQVLGEEVADVHLGGLDVWAARAVRARHSTAWRVVAWPIRLATVGSAAAVGRASARRGIMSG